MKWTPLLAAVLLGGCGTMNTARPLSPGEHAVGATFGGAVVDLGAPIPVPNLVVEGRSGLAEPAGRPLDLNYGLNLTALAFGVVGTHLGASWLLCDDRGAAPALSLGNRIYVYGNHLDTRKAPDRRGLWGLDQVELTASWDPGGQLVYLGVAEYLDFGAPSLLLSPFVGTELDPGRAGGVGFQIELRYFALNRQPVSGVVPWVSAGPGALGLTLGLRHTLGRREM